MAKLNAFLLNNMAGKTTKSQDITKEEPRCESTSHQVESPVTSGVDSTNESSVAKQEISVQTVDSCLPVNYKEDDHPNIPSYNIKPFPWSTTHNDPKEEEEPQSSPPDLEVAAEQYYNWHGKEEPLTYHDVQEAPQIYHQVQSSIENAHEDDTIPLVDQSSDDDMNHDMNLSSDESDDQGVVIVVDNSNIYIGAQECASANNASEKKRHVRVKLQNLVKILEKNRLKERTFVCGSSPPATEHVWDIYRWD